MSAPTSLPASARTQSLSELLERAGFAAVLLTPLVDRRLAALGLAPHWWMRLRVPLSVGLALLTAIVAVLAWR